MGKWDGRGSRVVGGSNLQPSRGVGMGDCVAKGSTQEREWGGSRSQFTAPVCGGWGSGIVGAPFCSRQGVGVAYPGVVEDCE